MVGQFFFSIFIDNFSIFAIYVFVIFIVVVILKEIKDRA